MNRILESFLSILLLAGFFTGCNAQDGLSIKEAEKRDDIIAASYEGISLSLSDYAYWYRMNQMEMEQEAINGGLYTVETLADYWEREKNGITMAQSLKETSLADAKHFANLLKLANDAETLPDEGSIEERTSLIDDALAALDEDPEKAALRFLEKYDITPNQMKRMYLGMGLVDQYIADLNTKMEVSDAELKSEYESNPVDFDMVTVRHVLVLCDESMSQAEKDEAKTKAEDIFARLSEGADIGALAKEHSEDPGSVDNNGEYTFGRGEMVTEFEEWAFAANEGDTGIVQTSYGYHVMQSMAKPGFDDVKEIVKSKVIYDKISDIIDKSYEMALLRWEENDSVINSLTPDKPIISSES